MSTIGMVFGVAFGVIMFLPFAALSLALSVRAYREITRE